MESESSPLRKRVAVVSWAYLPQRPLAIIARRLTNAIDITVFRSVCRSWRSFISPPPPPNKLSLLLPGFREPINLIASTVYLLRHRQDPSTSWMLSVQESEAGKLIPGHALTQDKIVGSSGRSLDLSELSVTQIARSFGYNKFCKRCDQMARTVKVVFLSDSDPSHGSEGLAMCGVNWLMYLRAFRLGLSDEETVATESVDGVDRGIEDVMNFNGRIYAIDTAAYVHVLDHETLQLVPVDIPNLSHLLRATPCRKRFVVSDGDLYVVLRFYCESGNTTPECRVYKLVLDEIDVTRCKWENVESLGDRVFFINRDCSFSVSARDLPHPWKGDCIVLENEAFLFPLCGCFVYEKEIGLFQLGVGVDQHPQFKLMSSLQGYSDLFAPLHPGLIRSCSELSKWRRPDNANYMRNVPSSKDFLRFFLDK